MHASPCHAVLCDITTPLIISFKCLKNRVCFIKKLGFSPRICLSTPHLKPHSSDREGEQPGKGHKDTARVTSEATVPFMVRRSGVREAVVDGERVSIEEDVRRAERETTDLGDSSI